MTHELVVGGGEGEDDARLDSYVAARLDGITRAQVKRLIDDGHVTVNGAPPGKAGARLRAGDRVRVHIPPAEPIAAAPNAEVAAGLVILFEDEHLIVIDKPAGLVVHPAPGHADGTLVNGLLAHCDDLSGIGGDLRPGIVHRLDKDTSGVLVVTKSDVAHQALSAAFAAKDLLREYLAVVYPAPKVDHGTINTLYGRHPVDRKKFSSKVSRGKTAVTHWRIAERFASGAALVQLRLETGRTHQIRVHMSDSGWPLLGDPVYGRPPKDPVLGPLARQLGRQALHAARLEITHPVTGASLRFATEPPPDLQRLLAALRGHAAPA